MSVAPLSAAQLHEPILPLAQPPRVVLQPDHTIAQTLDSHPRFRERALDSLLLRRRRSRTSWSASCRRAGWSTAAPEQTVRDVMEDNVVAIPDWATVLIASEYFATRRLLAFPVVNAAGQLRRRRRRQPVHG